MASAHAQGVPLFEDAQDYVMMPSHIMLLTASRAVLRSQHVPGGQPAAAPA
jgi:hypothetical protein